MWGSIAYEEIDLEGMPKRDLSRHEQLCDMPASLYIMVAGAALHVCVRFIGHVNTLLTSWL